MPKFDIRTGAFCGLMIQEKRKRLTCSVPNLQLNSLPTNIYNLTAKLHANCMRRIRFEFMINKLVQNARFANTSTADDEKFEEIIVGFHNLQQNRIVIQNVKTILGLHYERYLLYILLRIRIQNVTTKETTKFQKLLEYHSVRIFLKFDDTSFLFLVHIDFRENLFPIYKNQWTTKFGV